MKPKKNKDKDTVGIRVEYKETLYSADSGVTSSTIPPRKEWEHVSVVEEKIDKMYRLPSKKEKDIERKIDRLLSKKKK
mgnify:FL=1